MDNTDLNLNFDQQKKIKLPVVTLRGLVAFPDATIGFDIGRFKSIQAIEFALSKDSFVFLTAQKNAAHEEPDIADVFPYGTVARIKQVFRLPGNVIRVLADGVSRASVLEFDNEGTFLMADVSLVETFEIEEASTDVLATIRVVQDAFEEYVRLANGVAPDAIMEVITCEMAGKLSDLIGVHTSLKVENKQELLEEEDPANRIFLAAKLLHEELAVLTVQKDVLSKVKTNIDKHQREYYLKEQLKVVQEELNEKETVTDDIEGYKARAKEAQLPEHAGEKLNYELKRLSRTNMSSQEAVVIRDYIDWLLDLPWAKKSEENKDLKEAKQILDTDHFGLEKVKERIVEFLAVRQAADKANSPIICLVGPPGVGKTSIAKSVAKALNRKYIRMSLGGVRDEAEIRGHRKTYVGAMPGRIIYSMKQSKTLNPLILLDEIDKMSSDFRGNPASAMLEALDAEQNSFFRDHYLEVAFDLSDVMFMCTANSLNEVPPALRDRLEVINISSYTDAEKVSIAKEFLLPKQLEKHGLVEGDVSIPNYEELIGKYTKEAGVRQLERTIADICRKVVTERVMNGTSNSVEITTEKLEHYLGKPKFRKKNFGETSEIGIAYGLAWTSVGGDTLSIEVNVVPGSGKFVLTGNLGDVMKESAQAAMSFIRSRYRQFNLDKQFYKHFDVHIHLPEGAVPKDGPSAGITLTTAMVSALAEIPVKNDVCMTGEVTIRGKVLPIGGLKEKISAAKSNNFKTVVLPLENQLDLHEVPENVREGLAFIFAASMDEVLECALQK